MTEHLPESCQHKLLFECTMDTYPVLFRCAECEEIITCTCFSGFYSFEHHIAAQDRSIQRVIELEGVCHLCTGRAPWYLYGHEMYYTKFLQRYLPYHELLMRKKYGRPLMEQDPRYKECEKELKEQLGMPIKDNRLFSETVLFKLVSELLPNHEIVRHYRGKELERLEIDIWLPELKVGIEYQGQQHFKPVTHWGGEEGLTKRQYNDLKKAKLFKQLGYKVIYFDFHDSLTMKNVCYKIGPYLPVSKAIRTRLASSYDVATARFSGDLDQMLFVTWIKPREPIDRHYLLLNIVVLSYKLRAQSHYRDICIQHAKMHVDEMPDLIDAVRAKGGYALNVHTFQHYATLLAEDGDFQRAIEVCEQAIAYGLKDGTKSGYEGRIERIRKKAGR